MSRPRRLTVVIQAGATAYGASGLAGYGAVVSEAATGEELVERGSALSVVDRAVAEYRGLIAGLQAAADLGAVAVEVRMDAKDVVDQMSGSRPIQRPGLRTLAAKAAGLVARFDTARLVWVPRELNQRAHAVANAAIAAQTAGQAPPSPFASELAAWGAPPEGGATRIILVRHAATVLTATRAFSGRGDARLSALGRRQAAAVAHRMLELVDPDAVVVSSPLSRCVETAEAIGAATGAVLAQDDGLVECDFGAWEGLTAQQVRQRWPQRFDAWLSGGEVAPPGGESVEQVSARVRLALTKLMAERVGRLLVVVSHVTPIKLVLRDALCADQAFMHRLFLDPTGISIVDRYTNGRVAVRTVNDTAHLVGVDSDGPND